MTTLARPRFYPNDGPLLSIDLRAEFQVGIEKLVREYPPIRSSFDQVGEGESPSGLFGIFGGPTSVAHFFLRLAAPSESNAKFRVTEVAGKSCREWAKAYLDVSADMSKNPLVLSEEAQKKQDDFHVKGTNLTKQCGVVVEEPSFQAVSAALTGDATNIEYLIDMAAKLTEHTKDDWDEIVYGRGSFLYLVRLVNTYQPGAIPHSAIKAIIETMLSNGPDSERRWLWHGGPKIYLGAGHGWIGIITSILLSDASYAERVKPWLEMIISWQRADGNWPAHVPGTNPDADASAFDDFMQWGHGGPSVVTSFMNILPIYAHDTSFQDKLRDSIQKAQDAIWTRGLLSKEPCLIHGAAGNALALTDTSKRNHFLANSTESVVEEGLKSGKFEPSSLNSGSSRGLAGRAWAMYAAENGYIGRVLGYTDL